MILKITLPVIVLVSLLFPGIIISQATLHAQNHFSICVEGCAGHKRLISPENIPPPEKGDPFDIHYLDMSFTLDPAHLFVEGSVCVHFTVSDYADTLGLLLHDDLEVMAVEMAGMPASFFRPGDHNLLLPLRAMLPPGTIDSIRIDYKGVPPEYAGTGSVFTSIHQGKPTLWTLSEPYGAFTWWPSKLSLTDKADSVSLRISNPEGYRAATIGMKQTEYTVGGVTTSVWKHRYPVTPYLIGLAVADYYVYTEAFQTSYGSIDVLNYVYPDNPGPEQTATSNLSGVYELFAELFGPYPFSEERYGHVQCGMGGGMEHQTMTFAGPFNHHLLSHELAHSWFGNKITTGAWKDIWLNEGFATYGTGLTYQYMFNGFYWEQWKRETIAAVCSEPDGSVYVEDTTSPARIFNARLSYHKAALLLHMIRYLLGDESFFGGIRAYLEDPTLSFGYARTPDLIRHLETTSGWDLEPFMQQWFYGEGFPSYTTQWNQPNEDTLHLTVWQQTSHTSVSFFEMPLEYKIFGKDHDTLIRIYPSQNGESFDIKTGFRVDSIRFDPGLWLISSGNKITGIDENTKAIIRVFPNPAADFVQFSGISGMQVQFTLSDLSGRTLMYIPDFSGSADLRNLPAGMYFYGIYHQGKRFATGKLIKNAWAQ